MIASIRRAVRCELRAHRRDNQALRDLASRHGYVLCWLFSRSRWLLLPGTFLVLAFIAVLVSFCSPKNLTEIEIGIIKDVMSYVLAAQVTFVALAIPVIVAGAQLLLSGRSARGREADLAMLLQLGRPREVTQSSLALVAVLLILFAWPHESLVPTVRGARPFILAAAIVWFLINLAGYWVFILTAIELVSSDGRNRLRRKAISWFGFDKEIGERNESRHWFEFRKNLENEQLAYTMQQPAHLEQWFGFSTSGLLVDVRTGIFRVALKRLHKRDLVGPGGLGICFFLRTNLRPGRQFSVKRSPDMITRTLLRLSLVIDREALLAAPTKDFTPRAIIKALASDVEYLILTGTPADADAVSEELFGLLLILLRACRTAQGSYAEETPLLSLLSDWAQAIFPILTAAAGAMDRSPLFAANLAERLAQKCVETARADLSSTSIERFSEMLGALLRVVSRRSVESQKTDSQAHKEFLRAGTRALGRALIAIDALPEGTEPWLAFRRRAERHLSMLKAVARSTSYVAWSRDFKALDRYAGVLAALALETGSSQIHVRRHSLPDDLWTKEWVEASKSLQSGDTVDTAATLWKRQALIDRLLLVQLVWAGWVAKKSRSEIEFIRFLRRLSSHVRGTEPTLARYFFSFGPLLRRFLGICQISGRDQLAPLNEFAHEIDGPQDSEKEGALIYLDAVPWVEALISALAVHALLAFAPDQTKNASIELSTGRKDDTLSEQPARRLLWKLDKFLKNFPDHIRQALISELPDFYVRLAALQSSIHECAELFGPDAGTAK